MSLAAYTMLQQEMVWIEGFEFLRKDFQDRQYWDYVRRVEKFIGFLTKKHTPPPASFLAISSDNVIATNVNFTFHNRLIELSFINSKDIYVISGKINSKLIDVSRWAIDINLERPFSNLDQMADLWKI